MLVCLVAMLTMATVFHVMSMSTMLHLTLMRILVLA